LPGRGGGAVISLITSAVTTAAATAARPRWQEERRLDRADRARIDREREAAQRLRQEAAAARRAQRAAAAAARAARLAALGAWVAGHVTELLFVPVIGVPALLAWTAMAAYGTRLHGRGFEPLTFCMPCKFSKSGAVWRSRTESVSSVRMIRASRGESAAD
jgi:hypothetical protein